MQFPIFTAMATGVLTILLVVLALLTSFGRRKYHQSIGSGANDELEKRVRSHGNLAEHGAVILLCLGLLEMSGASQMVMAGLCGWFVLARIAHPIGMLGKPGPNLPRFFGSMSTYLVGVIAGAWLIARVAMGLLV